MTTYARSNIRCANCGKSSEHHLLTSTNALGSADLDLRPPEMQRSTMGAWLQLCPHCDYCAPSLSDGCANADAMKSPAYREALGDQRYPELARRFLARAVLVADLDAEEAAHAHLRASWVCDDGKIQELAAENRSRAANFLSELKPFAASEKGISVGMILVDVLRRSSRFDEAERECEELLTREAAVGLLRKIIEFQHQLIARRDVNAYSIRQVVEGSKGKE